MGDLGATCFTTLSNKERDIEKAQWDKDRFGQVCTPSESFAKIKATILKFCELNKKRCEFEAVQQAENFDDKVQKSVKKGKKSQEKHKENTSLPEDGVEYANKHQGKKKPKL